MGPALLRRKRMLWLTGPPPADLRCPLVDGPRLPCPTLEHRDLPLPMSASATTGTWVELLAPLDDGRRWAGTEMPSGSGSAPARTRHGTHVPIERRTETPRPSRPQRRRRRRPSRIRGAARARCWTSLPNWRRTPSDEEVEIEDLVEARRRLRAVAGRLDGRLDRLRPHRASGADDRRVARRRGAITEAVAATIGELRRRSLVSSSSQADPESSPPAVRPDGRRAARRDGVLPLPQARRPSVRPSSAATGSATSVTGRRRRTRSTRSRS